MEILSSDLHAIRRQPFADQVRVFVPNKDGGTQIIMSKAQAELHALFRIGGTHTRSTSAGGFTFTVIRDDDGIYHQKVVDSTRDC